MTTSALNWVSKKLQMRGFPYEGKDVYNPHPTLLGGGF